MLLLGSCVLYAQKSEMMAFYWGSVNHFMNHDEISDLEAMFTVVGALLRKSEKKNNAAAAAVWAVGHS